MRYDDELEFEDEHNADADAQNPYDADAVEESATPTCHVCGGVLEDTYYTQAGNIVCPSCREAAEAVMEGGSGVVRFMKATAFGLLAALVGAAIMYGFSALTGYQSGLISILVGFLVGKGVMKGTDDRGGLKYQTLAVFLTYSAVAWSFLPMVLQAFFERAQAEQVANGAKEPGKKAKAPNQKAKGGEAAQAKAPDAKADADPEDEAEEEEKPSPGVLLLFTAGFLAVAMVFAYAAPLFALTDRSGVFMLLLIFFALRQAWRMTKRSHIVFHGPFDVNDGNSPAYAT